MCNSCDGVNFSENTMWWNKSSSGNYEYDGKTLGKIYIADAIDMNCVDSEKYDFVLSSNNLEHIANPIKALKEFLRVLKTGGVLTLVVPRKDRTFDHKREFTKFEHILEDYQNNTQEDDLTHMPEIIELHDYDMDDLCNHIDKEEFKRRAALNIQYRNLHHHVFSEECLRKIFEFLNLKIISSGECLWSSNYIIIGKK